MTETDPRATSREERDAARADARDARIERDAEVLARTTPSPVTALDGLGTERIITTTTGYTPPQVDPDEREVARLAALQTRLDNAKQARLDSLTAAPSGDTGAAVAAAAIAAESSAGTPATTTEPAGNATATSSTPTGTTPATTSGSSTSTTPATPEKVEKP
jgi:hypothetical protein